MKNIKIALVQMRSEKGQLNDNLDQIEAYIKRCKDKNAEIVCFPEMSITGYIDPIKFPQGVLSLNSAPVKRFIELSGLYGILAIAGIAEENPDGKPYITQLAALNGELLCSYRKINVADNEAELFTQGEDIGAFDFKGIKFGLAVCADINKEDVFKAYAASGAELVFECAAPGLYGEQATRDWYSGFNWWRSECFTKLGRYAKDNSIYIAVSTQAGRTIDEDFPGGGYTFSPEGNCICETLDWSESVLYTPLAIE